MNALLIFNSRGECIIQQTYKNTNSSIQEHINKFKKQITSNTTYDQNCVLLIAPYSFIFIRYHDIVLCAITNTNTNVFNTLSLEHQFINTIKLYCDNEEELNAQFISTNAVLVLEILNEMIDGGYPQTLMDETLLIHPKPDITTCSLQQARNHREIVSLVTGSVAWRKQGIKYNMGFSVGGAKDVQTFRDSIQKRILPKASSLTYNGLFYDYYFQNINAPKQVHDEVEEEGANKLFYPSYCVAKSEDEYYISVGLNSNMKTDEFHRNKLNLTLILDISGSMRGAFDAHNDMIDDGRCKIDVAKECLIELISKHLHDDDMLSILLFNRNVQILQPFVIVKDMNLSDIISKINAIEAAGGTQLLKPFETAVALYSSMDTTEAYDNRVIYLTDAQQNLSYNKCNYLIDLCKEYSLKSLKEGRICTTFIGVGIDFNTDLVNKITSELHGANYYAIHSAKEFNKRMVDEFDLMVNPLIFNLKLEMNEEGNNKQCYIDKIYGHKNEDKNYKHGLLMDVKTLFPSRCNEENEVKGGIIMLKVRPMIANEEKALMTMELKVSYEDRYGNTFGNKERVCFDAHIHDKLYSYDNNGIRKAVLLVKYVQLLKEWIANNVEFFISPYYRKQFEQFLEYFRSEMQCVCDKTLQKEVDILQKLIHLSTKTKPGYLPLWRAHEVSLRVSETINVMVHNRNSGDNKISYAGCKGKIIMNSRLSGMPVITMGLYGNNAQLPQKVSRRRRSFRKKVNYADYRFHACVRFGAKYNDQQIKFTPPDGQFELLSYELCHMKNIKLPFDLIHDIKYELKHIDYDIKLIPQFEKQFVAKDIRVKIPVYTNSERVRKNGVQATKGSCALEDNHLVWNISTLNSEKSVRFYGRVYLKNDTNERIYGNNRGLISLQFKMENKIMSSIKVLYLNVTEKTGYKTHKRVQYITETDDIHNVKFML